VSKDLKKVAKIVGIAALAFTGVGLGFLAVGAGVGLSSALGMTAIGGLTFGTVGAIGLAAWSIGSAPSIPVDKTGANARGNTFSDPNALGIYAFGRTTVPCAIIYEEVTGAEPDRLVHDIFAHCWHRIEAFVSLSLGTNEGSEVISFSGTAATGDFTDLLWWFRADGTQSAALSGTRFDDNSWPSGAVFERVTHSALVWNVDDANFIARFGSIPSQVDVVADAAWLYDPREDTSAGGSGSQDLEDPSTWSFNNGNAALVLLRFLIGEYNDAGDLVWGRGAGYADIDLDSFAAMAAVADETVDSKPRFRLGGVWALNGSFDAFVQMWEAETGGKLSKSGGLYRCWLPHDDLTPLTTITEADFLSDASVGSELGRIETLYNTARGRYIEPTQGYRAFPYPEVDESSAITDDGGKRVLTQEFSWVQDVEIAQRIARIKVRRSRFQRVWSVTLGWKAQGPNYRPFTVHTLNCKETGGDNQLVRVVAREMAFDGRTKLIVQQEDVSIYDDTVALGDPHASNTIPNRIDRVAVTPRLIGADGDDGVDGADAVIPSVVPEFAQWRQAPNGGAFAPTATTCDVTFTFLQGGATIATHVVRATRSGATITAATQSESGDATTETIIGGGTSVITILVEHTASGVTGAQAISVVVGGDDGDPGAPGADGDDGADGADGEDYWTPALSANMQRTGKSFFKTGSDSVWDSGFYSMERYGACQVSFQPAQTDEHFMIGLNPDPATDHNYTSIDYALYCLNDGTLQAYESGSLAATFGAYAAGDALAVQYDGQHVRYLQNGTVLRTVSDGGERFAADASFYGVGAQADNVAFVPIPMGKLDLATQVSGQLAAAFAGFGVNELSGSVATGQLTANVLAALQAVIGNLAAISANIGSITAGSITFNSSGAFVQLGTATAHDTGIGFRVEYNGGTPRLFLGNAAGDKMLWDGSGLEIVGDITANYSKADWGATQTFTPSWVGFSSDPSGDWNYAISTDGRLAMLWTDVDLFGTSDDVTMSFSLLPTAIRPSGATVVRRVQGVGLALANTIESVPVVANIFPASHASAGVVIFGTFLGGGTRTTMATNQWVAGSTTKGIYAGTRFVWPIG
jgi:hypothetical protein